MKLVSQRFVWQELRKDVSAWVSSCVDCQGSKVHRHIKAPFGEFTVPERRFDHVNVILVGPLPSFHGFTYLFTMVDRTTGWPEAVPLSSTRGARVHRYMGRALWDSFRPLLGPGLAVHLGTLERGG